MSTTNMANMAEKCQQIAKTMQHFSFSCLSKFDFGIENLWNILFQKFDMFLWTSGFQNPLVHTDFDMFVDE